MNALNRFFDRIPGWKLFSLLAVCALILSFYHLSGRFLFSGDETRVAGIIRGMLLPGPLFLPRLNGTPFLEYPPLYYWGGAFFMSVFGVCTAAAKATSALSFFASILLTYALARKLEFSKGASFAAGIMLGFSISFFMTGRTCIVDMTLCCMVLLAVFGFYSGMTAKRLPSRIFHFILYTAGTAGAIMTKGLLGLALPGIVLFFTLLFRDIRECKLHWKEWLILAGCSLAALIPVGLWLAELYYSLGSRDFYEVVYSNNIGRFTGSQKDHAVPFYYYLQRLPQLFQPWLLLIPFGLFALRRKFRRESDPAALFLLCAFLAPLLLLTVSAGKRIVYLIPVYPAMALTAATGLFFLLDLVGDKISEEKLTARLPFIGLIILFLLTAGSIVLLVLKPDFYGWAVLPLLSAVSGIVLFFRKKTAAAWVMFLLAFSFFLPWAEGTLPHRFSRDRDLTSLFHRVSELEKQGETIYLYQPMERILGAAVYYRGKLMPIRKQETYDGKSREIWLFRKRDRKNPSRYGNDFRLVRMPDKTEL